jgi:hypothetical protein
MAVVLSNGRDLNSHGASNEFTIKNPSHPASRKDSGWDDDSRDAMSICPHPQRNRFVPCAPVRLPEHFDGSVRHSKLEKHYAIQLAVPRDEPHCAGAPLYDLRNQDLPNETFFVEIGRFEGPRVKVTTEDGNRIRRRYRIGNNPELGRPTQ